MCFEDVLIGRASVARPIDITLATTFPETPQIVNNADRTALVIPSHDTSNIFLASAPGQTADQGILIPANNGPWVIELSKMGPLVIQPWWLLIAAGAATVTAFEVTLPASKLDEVREYLNEHRNVRTRS